MAFTPAAATVSPGDVRPWTIGGRLKVQPRSSLSNEKSRLVVSRRRHCVAGSASSPLRVHAFEPSMKSSLTIVLAQRKRYI